MKTRAYIVMVLAWAVLLLACLYVGRPVAAQGPPESTLETLTLGDEESGTLEVGERIRYRLALEDTDEPVDIVLFSERNGILAVYDEEGGIIKRTDLVWDYGNEVFTWQPGDRMPTEIEVSLLFGQSGDYTLSILPAEQLNSQEYEPGEQVKRSADLEIGQTGKRTNTLRYLLYVPERFAEDQQYPLILFLHGSGETGSRLDFLKGQVLPKLIEEGQDFPFIIASPQLDFGTWELKKDVLASLVAQLQSELPIDPDRVYVTGLSLGGSGAWHFALAYPEIPAAVVPMAGFYNFGSASAPPNICDLAEIPMWVFHGVQDEVVDLAWEQSLVDALEECGADVKFTIYPDANHEQSFVQGYAEPDLYTWLLEQHK